MGAVSRSMQKWVQNGQPLTVDKEKSIELELRLVVLVFENWFYSGI